MLVSCVHPVPILSAVFCTICSLSMFVSDAYSDLILSFIKQDLALSYISLIRIIDSM